MQASAMILHQTSFDGGLYLTYPIIGLMFEDDLQLSITVSHETKTNSFDNSVVSSWKITGLETWLVCTEDNKLTWCSPSGATVDFNKDLLSRQKSVASEGCTLTIVSKDEYVVTDEKSREWFYVRGSLSRLRVAKDKELSFKCGNGLIREITIKNNVIFSLRQHGTFLLFFAGGRSVAAIGYDATGQLIESIAFEDGRRPSVKFSYQNNNLTTITEGDAMNYEFVWKRVSFFKNYFSTLLFPYYLYSDGHYTYGHTFYFGKATMTATDMSGHREKKNLVLKTGLVTDE